MGGPCVVVVVLGSLSSVCTVDVGAGKRVLSDDASRPQEDFSDTP